MKVHHTMIAFARCALRPSHKQQASPSPVRRTPFALLQCLWVALGRRRELDLHAEEERDRVPDPRHGHCAIAAPA
jgi:hypothetical protein